VSAAVKDSVRKSLGSAIKIVNRLMDDWCGRVIAAVDALAKAGPLQPALELLVRQLAKAALSLKEQKAPGSAVDAIKTTGGEAALCCCCCCCCCCCIEHGWTCAAAAYGLGCP
jgi:hypothetical protein